MTPVVVWPLIALVNTHVVGEEGINKETKQLNVTSALLRPRASVSGGASAVPMRFHVEIIACHYWLGQQGQRQEARAVTKSSVVLGADTPNAAVRESVAQLPSASVPLACP